MSPIGSQNWLLSPSATNSAFKAHQSVMCPFVTLNSSNHWFLMRILHWASWDELLIALQSSPSLFWTFAQFQLLLDSITQRFVETTRLFSTVPQNLRLKPRSTTVYMHHLWLAIPKTPVVMMFCVSVASFQALSYFTLEYFSAVSCFALVKSSMLVHVSPEAL